MQTEVLIYSRQSLWGDYLRALCGLTLGLGILLYSTGEAWVVIVFGGLTGLFAYFAWRTLERHRLKVTLTSAGIDYEGLVRRVLPWSDLRQIKLRFFGSRHQHKKIAGGEAFTGGGFLHLTLRSQGVKLDFESSLYGFSYLAWCAVQAGRRQGLSIDPTSAGNFLAIGIDVDNDGPAPAIERPGDKKPGALR